MELLGKLISHLKKASHDFQFHSFHKKSCLTYVMYSQNLNQIIAIKFPNRDHYIPKGIALNYLQSTRKFLEKTFGTVTCKNSYTLNILISNRLTESCFELVNPGNDRNMDMLFSTKKTTDKEILKTVLHALGTKTRSWSNKIKSSCHRKQTKPFSKVKDKIRDLDRAADIFEVLSSKYEVKKKCQR